MKIYYQWNTWSYMDIASQKVSTKLNTKIEDIIWMPEFSNVWENIWNDSIWVLAIENSYMWSIHPNLYGFLKYDFKIIWEYYLKIRHCLASKEKEIKNVKKAYSQTPALEQCHKYLKEKWIVPIDFSDTSLAAKYVWENKEEWVAAICSKKAAGLYKLNILDEDINDNKENTTRFAIIVKKNSCLKYRDLSSKVSIIFEAKNIPSSLYKCLWAFATNNINLSKIESLPSYKGKFSYYFWLEFEWKTEDKNVKKALLELKFFTKFIKVLGEY